MRHWLARQRYLIDYTVASLARRKARNLGLLLIYAALVFALASVLLYSHALRRDADRLLEGAPEMVVQKLTAGRQDRVPAAWLERLRAIRGVRSAEGRQWGYYFDATVGANYTVMVPADRAVPAHTAILGSAVARVRGAAPGDVMALRGHDNHVRLVRVAEVLPRASDVVTADLILLSGEDFGALFGLGNESYTDLTLAVAHPREVRKVAEKVVALFPEARPVLREEMRRTYAALFDWREGLVLVVLAGALFAFAILAWDKASGLSADERREIGVLKAIGWETGDVLKMKLWEGALISLFAFLTGFVLAWCHVFLFGAPLFAPVLQGWSVLKPAMALTPAIDGLQLASLFIFTVVPYTAATLVPVWRAAITDPDAVMR